VQTGFYKLSAQASSLPPAQFTYHHEKRLPVKSSCFNWKPQQDIPKWVASQAKYLREEQLGVTSTDIATLQKAIFANPEGLTTTIEWRTGKLQLLTKRQGSTWKTVQRKFSQAALFVASRVDTRCEELAEVDNLAGWLKCQAAEIMRTNPEFGWDDMDALEDSIRKNPMGLTTMLEWDAGRWHLMIRESRDEEGLWHCRSVLEETEATPVSAFDQHWAVSPDGGMCDGCGRIPQSLQNGQETYHPTRVLT